MFDHIYRPLAELKDGEVVRRAGLFYKKRVRLRDLERVLAVVKDAVTHEEVVVGFFDQRGRELWLSEFDRGFKQVMSSLEKELPTFHPANDLAARQPFEGAQKVLWQRGARP